MVGRVARRKRADGEDIPFAIVSRWALLTKGLLARQHDGSLPSLRALSEGLRAKMAARRAAAERVPGRWQNLRFFVSSTFVDTQSERDVLVKEVFPELNQKLKSRWVRCAVVDLRWGVSAEETSVIQRTCLNEIDRCRHGIENLPWFIALRGERYGWIQEKYDKPTDFDRPEHFGWLGELDKQGKKISITSMEVLHAFLCLTDKQATIKHPHAFAYFRDPGFIHACPEEHRWMFDFDYVPEDAAVPEHSRLQYTPSRQHNEIRQDLADLNLRIRDATGLCKSRDFQCGFDRAMVTATLPSGKRLGCGYTSSLTEFRQMVFDDVWDAVSREFPPFQVVPDPLTVERLAHEDAVASRAANFLGRHQLLQAMRDFCDSPAAGSHGPLVIHGLPGAGKSAVMARFCQSYARDHAGDPAVLCLQHIVGASAASVSLRAMLKRLCTEIKEHFELEAAIPDDVQELVMDAWPAMVRAACQYKKIVVVIDAVNQLSSQDYAHMMKWVFDDSDCNQRFRLILSTLEHQCLDSLRAKQPAPREIQVQPLSLEERKEVVRDYLAQFHKKLSENPSDPLLQDQMALLLAKERADSPLFLIAASERLRTFGIFERITPYIKNTLPGTIPDLFKHILEETEKIHGAELTRVATSVIYCSKGGMSELEMVECLSLVQWEEEEVSNFSRLYGNMTTFLSTGGGGNLQFFHQQLQFVVESCYGLQEHSDSWKATHRVLARYFQDVVDTKKSNFDRGLMCLPFHLLNANMFEELRALMCDLNFIEQKCSHDMTYDLIEDFKSIMTHPHLPSPDSWPGHHELSDFYGFVKLQGPFLQKRPHLVFQVAHNQPDDVAPSRAARAIEKDEHRPWIQWVNKSKVADSQLMHLVGHQRATLCCIVSADEGHIYTCSRDQTVRAWHATTGAEVNRIRLHDGGSPVSLASLKPLARSLLSMEGLGDEVVCCLQEQSSEVLVCDVVKGSVLAAFEHGVDSPNCIATSKDSTTIAVGGGRRVVVVKQTDQAFRVAYDLVFQCNTGLCSSVVLSATGNALAMDDVDGGVRVWRESGTEAKSEEVVRLEWLHEHDGLAANQANQLGYRNGVDRVRRNALAASPDFARLVLVSADNHIVACNTDALDSDKAPFTDADGAALVLDDVLSLAWSSDGAFVVVGGRGKRLHLLDVAQRKEVAVLVGHSWMVHSVGFSPSSAIVCSASGTWDKRCILWDVGKAKGRGGEASWRQFVPPHSDLVMASSIPPCFKWVVAGAFDAKHSLWSLSPSSIQLDKISPVDAGVVKLAHSPDSRLVASGGHHARVFVYGVADGKLLGQVHVVSRHAHATTEVEFSVDGRLLVTGSTDRVCVHETRCWTLVAEFCDVDCKRMCLSPDSSMMACVSQNQVVQVVPLLSNRPQPIAVFVTHHSSAVQGMAWSPSGSHIATASIDCHIHLFSTSTWQLTAKCSMWDRAYETIFSADGRLVISGGDDKTVGLWRVEDGKEAARIYVGGGVGTVSAAHNSRTIVAGDDVGRLLHLNLKNVDMGLPVVRAVVQFDTGGKEFADQLTITSPYDGSVFVVEGELLERVALAADKDEFEEMEVEVGGGPVRVVGVVDNRNAPLPGSRCVVAGDDLCLLRGDIAVARKNSFTVRSSEPEAGAEAAGAGAEAAGAGAGPRVREFAVSAARMWLLVPPAESSVAAGLPCLVDMRARKKASKGVISSLVKGLRTPRTPRSPRAFDKEGLRLGTVVGADGKGVEVRVGPKTFAVPRTSLVPALPAGHVVLLPLPGHAPAYAACRVVRCVGGEVYARSVEDGERMQGNAQHAVWGSLPPPAHALDRVAAVQGRVVVRTAPTDAPLMYWREGDWVEVVEDGAGKVGKVVAISAVENQVLVKTSEEEAGLWYSPHGDVHSPGHCQEAGMDVSSLFGGKGEQPDGLHSGAVVEGNWKNRGTWYPGKIAACNADGTYNIAYDDGDFEEGVDAPRIRSSAAALAELERQTNSPLAVGFIVEGNWKGRGTWYSGRIAACNADGTVDIAYDDGDFEAGVDVPRVRAPEPARFVELWRERKPDFDWDLFVEEHGGRRAPPALFRELERPAKGAFLEAHFAADGWCLATVQRVARGKVVVARCELKDDKLAVPASPATATIELGSWRLQQVGFCLVRRSCPRKPAGFDAEAFNCGWKQAYSERLHDLVPDHAQLAPGLALLAHAVAWQPGMAVEAKNRVLLERKGGDEVYCPATIERVENARALVALDGWSDEFKFWVDVPLVANAAEEGSGLSVHDPVFLESLVAGLDGPDVAFPFFCQMTGRKLAPPPMFQDAKGAAWTWESWLGERRVLHPVALSASGAAEWNSLVNQATVKWQAAKLLERREDGCLVELAAGARIVVAHPLVQVPFGCLLE